MAKPVEFCLEEFLAEADEGQSDVPICIPHGPFRIHPDKSRMAGPVYLSRAGDEWRLVHPEVANSYRVPQQWKADLFEGIRPDGRTFVVPLTYPLPGGEEWFNTLQQAIILARTQWVTVESDREQKCYLITPEAKKKLGQPEWPECEFSEIVEIAFFDRIVRTRQEAEKCFPKKPSRRVIREEFVE